MLTGLFLKGSLIGFSIAMPVGPVGVLCIQHSLSRGIIAGLIAGLGAAFADAFFGGMAGYGVSLFSHTSSSYQIWLQIIGALFLGFIGIKIFKSAPLRIQQPKHSFSRSKIFISTFALTLTNPLTPLCFAAIFTTLDINLSNQEVLPTLVLTLGVLLGATIWWLLLTFGVILIGKKFQLNTSPLLNRITGGFLTACGFLVSLYIITQFVK